MITPVVIDTLFSTRVSKIGGRVIQYHIFYHIKTEPEICQSSYQEMQNYEKHSHEQQRNEESSFTLDVCTQKYLCSMLRNDIFIDINDKGC